MTNNSTSAPSSTSHEPPASPTPGVSHIAALRRGDNRMIAGVCSGLATALGIDVTIVRLVAVLSALIGGLGPALYLAGWLVIPDSSGTIVGTKLIKRVTRRSHQR